VSGVIVIAIDGPAGSGKSSVSKAVAARLGYSYYDTGAAYRALAWAALDAGIDLDSEEAVVSIQDSAEYVASEDPSAQVFTINGVDVSEAIRGSDVSGSVSAIARHPREPGSSPADHTSPAVDSPPNPAQKNAKSTAFPRPQHPLRG